MEDAILEDGTIESKLALLSFYTTILNNWTVSVLTHTRLSPMVAPAITRLVDHANSLATVILQDSPDITALSKVLTFYETIGTLISQSHLLSEIRIPLPPSELVYTLHFSNSLDSLDRLCGLLSLYKTAFETARALDPNQYPQDYVNHFNGFLMDICNCIWRSHAFDTEDPNALGCLLPLNTTTQLEDYVRNLGTSINLSSLFSLSFSPVFCLIAISHLRTLEDAAQESIAARHPGPGDADVVETVGEGWWVRVELAGLQIGCSDGFRGEGC